MKNYGILKCIINWSLLFLVLPQSVSVTTPCPEKMV